MIPNVLDETRHRETTQKTQIHHFWQLCMSSEFDYCYFLVLIDYQCWLPLAMISFTSDFDGLLILTPDLDNLFWSPFWALIMLWIVTVEFNHHYHKNCVSYLRGRSQRSQAAATELHLIWHNSVSRQAISPRDSDWVRRMFMVSLLRADDAKRRSKVEDGKMIADEITKYESTGPCPHRLIMTQKWPEFSDTFAQMSFTAFASPRTCEWLEYSNLIRLCFQYAWMGMWNQIKEWLVCPIVALKTNFALGCASCSAHNECFQFYSNSHIMKIYITSASYCGNLPVTSHTYYIFTCSAIFTQFTQLIVAAEGTGTDANLYLSSAETLCIFYTFTYKTVCTSTGFWYSNAALLGLEPMYIKYESPVNSVYVLNKNIMRQSQWFYTHACRYNLCSNMCNNFCTVIVATDCTWTCMHLVAITVYEHS